VGDQLQLTVARDGSRTVTVTIGESS
jgi:hypothetical protein